MPKINEGLRLMLEAFTDEAPTDEEIEGIETAMDAEQQKELEQALQALFDERDEFSSRVDKAHLTLTKILVELATQEEEKEEEEEEEGGKKKVQKSPSWSFTLGQKIED